MKMNGRTEPQAQGHVVQSAVHDITRVRSAQRIYGRGVNAEQVIRLMPTPSGKEMSAIASGGILHTQNKKTRVDSKASFGNQHPCVLASLNYECMSKSEFDKIKGYTPYEKLLNAIMKNVRIEGVSLKSHNINNLNMDTVDQPVILRYGMKGMHNNGPIPIRPLDWVVADVPDPESPMQATNGFGVDVDYRSFITKPLESVHTVTADGVISFLSDRGFNKTMLNEFEQIGRAHV